MLAVLLPGRALGDGAFELYPTRTLSDVELGLTSQPRSSALPLYERPRLFNGKNGRTQNLLAVKWQHRLTQEHSFALSAGYGDDLYLENKQPAAVSTMASLSWTGEWGGRMRPRITGSLFVGDEDARDDPYRDLDRKYFGLTIGGRVTLFERHSPYLSFKMLRSDYDVDLSEDPFAPPAEYSRLTAGWDWQVRPNWLLRAGADYTLENFSLDLERYERSRIFFSTRFNFR